MLAGEPSIRQGCPLRTEVRPRVLGGSVGLPGCYFKCVLAVMQHQGACDVIRPFNFICLQHLIISSQVTAIRVSPLSTWRGAGRGATVCMRALVSRFAGLEWKWKSVRGVMGTDPSIEMRPRVTECERMTRGGFTLDVKEPHFRSAET